MYSCHLFIISSASVRSLPFLSFIVDPCMKCSLGIANFLEEISSVPHSTGFLRFLPLITQEGLSLLVLLWTLHSDISLDISKIFRVYLSFSPLPFASLLFSAICKASSDNHFAFLHFFYLGLVLITASCTVLQTSLHSSSGTLSIRSNPLNLFVTSTV